MDESAPLTDAELAEVTDDCRRGIVPSAEKILRLVEELRQARWSTLVTASSPDARVRRLAALAAAEGRRAGELHDRLTAIAALAEARALILGSLRSDDRTLLEAALECLDRAEAAVGAGGEGLG